MKRPFAEALCRLTKTAVTLHCCSSRRMQSIFNSVSMHSAVHAAALKLLSEQVPSSSMALRHSKSAIRTQLRKQWKRFLHSVYHGGLTRFPSKNIYGSPCTAQPATLQTHTYCYHSCPGLAAMNAPLSCSLLLAWCLWSLLSEAVLAVTHLKVLFCVGQPIPAKELSSKRWTYFLYDCLSPWLALAPVLAVAAAVGGGSPATAAAVAAAVPAAPSTAAAWPGLAPAAAPLHSHLLLQQTLNITGITMPAVPAASWTCQLDNSSCSCSSLECALSAPLQQQLLLLPTPAAPPAQSAAEAHMYSRMPAAPSTACAAVLMLLAGHAALHLYYIATWSSSRHSQNVIKMSAVSSGSSRWQGFRAWEVLWFWVGTSYDIVTHVVVSGLLLHAVRSAAQCGCALPLLPWQ